MKKEVFKTSFATYSLYDEQILEQYWSNEQEEMTEEAYMKDMLHYVRIVHELQPHSALINLQSFFFIINNELQEWVDKNVTGKAVKYIKKIAFVMPNDMIERLSVELTMSEAEATMNLPLGIAYFDETDTALQWLKKQALHPFF